VKTGAAAVGLRHTVGVAPGSSILTALPTPTWQTAAWVVGVFAAAWLVSRGSGRLAGWIVRRNEARHLSGDGPADTGVMTSLKRRETAISLVRTSVRYAAYGLALILAVGALSFGNRIGTVAGASLFVLLIGFAAQRFLTDILAGFFMFFEGWFSVGDNVTIEPLNLQGIVDEVGLRSTRLRAITGEVVRVHNSQILSVRVQPRGARELEIEFFATSEEAGRELVAEVARIVPSGATRLVRVPWVEEVEHLDDDLVRIRARATVAHGREWLVETFLPDLLKERGEDVIVHGPVVWHVDESASREFARTLGMQHRAR
jgi:moderate conductance mechanosensitive channel